MDATIRTAAADTWSGSVSRNFFSAPTCLYSPVDLERDFSVSKGPDGTAGDGKAPSDEDIERLMTQTTISSSYEGAMAAAAPRSPVASTFDDQSFISQADEMPMYSRPVLSACAVSRDGAFIAAVSGHLLVVWRWTGKGWKVETRARLPERVKYMGVVFIRTNLEVVVAGSDGTAYVVQRSSGNPLTSMQHAQDGGHGRTQHASFYAINGLRVCPREQLLVTWGGDGRAVVWDTTHKVPLLATQYEAPRTAPSKVIAKHAAFLKPETIALLEGQQELAVKMVDALFACDVSPEEQWLATGGEAEVVHLWDMSHIRAVQDSAPAMQSQSSPKHTLRHAHGARISALCFNPTGPTLAAGDVRGVLVLWDILNLCPVARIQGHSMSLTSLCFAPTGEEEGETLITAGLDGCVKVWRGLVTTSRRASADEMLAFSDDKPAGPRKADAELRGHNAGVTQVHCFRRNAPKQRRAHGPNGQASATLSLSTTTLTTTLGELSSTLSPKSRSHLSLRSHNAAAPRSLLTCGVDQRLYVWAHPGGHPPHNGLSDGGFSPNGSGDTGGGCSALALALHVFYKGRQPSDTAVCHAALSPCGTRLLTCRYQDLRAFVWALGGPRAGQLCHVLSGHQRALSALTFGEGANGLVAAGDAAGRVCLWRLGSQERPVSSVYTHANLPWLCGESQAPRPSWAPDTDRPSGLLEPVGHWDDHGVSIRHVAFCRGDTWLLSADALGHFRVCDVATRETLYALSGGDRVSGPVRGLVTAAAPWAHPLRGPSTTLLQRPLGLYGCPGQGGGETCWVLAASPTEVLLWKADSGEVYARQTILPEREEGEAEEEGEGERDVIVSMDCVLVLPSSAPYPIGPTGAEEAFAPSRPASETPPSSAASLASSSSPSSTSEGRVHVCICTRQGQAVVWAVSIADPAVSSVQRLGAPLSNGRPMQLDGIAFQGASADRVLAWGPADVALWERFAVSGNAGSEKGKGGQWGDVEEGEDGDASVFVSREAEGGREEAAAAGTVTSGLSAASEYRLVYGSQVGEAEFMHGCCLAGWVPGSGAVRLVLREGWVLEQAVGQEGR